MKTSTLELVQQLLEELKEEADFNYVEGMLSLRKQEKLFVKVNREERTEEETKWLEQVDIQLNSQLANNRYRASDFAFDLNLSERQFRRRMKELTGMTPVQYFKEIRLQAAKILLTEKRYKSVIKVAAAVGINDAGAFSRNYKKRFGVNPSEFFKKN